MVTLLCLFGVKAMGLIWALANGERRRSFGGAGAIVRSAVLEILLAILLAPVTMVTQTKAMIGLLLGVPSNWTVQSREAARIPLREVLPKVREHLALAAAFIAAGVVDPVLGLWLSPVIAGLLASPWLISLTSSTILGERLARWGVFTVPAADDEGNMRLPETAAPRRERATRKG